MTVDFPFSPLPILPHYTKNHDPIAEVVIFVDVDHYLSYSYPYGSVGGQAAEQREGHVLDVVAGHDGGEDVGDAVGMGVKMSKSFSVIFIFGCCHLAHYK